MKNHYQVSSTYIRLMLQADTETAGLIRQELGPKLDEALDLDYLPGELINQMFETFEVFGLDSWAIKYAPQLSISNHGPLGFAAISAPDLATAMQTFTEYSVIRTSGFSTELRFTEKHMEYVVQDQTDHTLAGRWLIESSFLVAQNLIETITAHPLGDNAELSFAYSKPKHYRGIEKLYNAPCKYDAPENSLSIPIFWSKIPSPLHDIDAYHSNVAKCRDIKLNLDKDKSNVLMMVESRLQNHFDRRLSGQARSETIPSLAVIAGELCMSQRTLIRKLASQRSAYKTILEQTRLEYAKMLLTQTYFTAAEIAYKLGYVEPANFGRAFRRWTGKTPGNWRRAR